MSTIIDARFAGGSVIVDTEQQVVGVPVITIEAPSEVIPLREHEAVDLALAIANHLRDDAARALFDRLMVTIASRTAPARTLRRAVGVDEHLATLDD